jgi:plastocyanin
VERSQRIGLLVAAVVVAVVAAILISNGDDDDSSSTDSTVQTTTGGGTTTTEKAEVPTITIKDGKPVGGVQEIEVDKGDTVRFRVKSDADHEIHMHGYDIAKDVEAGGEVTYNVPADIDGIFEIEIEDLKEPIAELRVNP